jgi:hypothetical protein
MGEKKQSEKFKKTAYKVIAVIAGILFVVLMVVSSMGSGWISGLAGVKPGDVVVISYTLQDAQGNPLVTSDQTLYKQIVASGYDVLPARQLTITANHTISTPVFPVQVYTSQSGWASQYGIFASEYNAITNGLVGMKVNDKKKIQMASGIPLTQYWTADQLKARQLNLSDMQVGSVIPLGVSANPGTSTDNSTPTYYIRLGEVTGKDADGVTIDFAHPAVDVSVVSINPRTSNG